MSEFIALLPPPGASVAKYDRTQPHSAQPESVPGTFREAMSIREAVYVTEQHVPLENEFDYDDARSWHWVVYASVGTSSTSPISHSPDPRAKRGSTASRLAVGTIRLVPPPHPPHPHPGSQHKIDNIENRERVPITQDAVNSGPKSAFNPHNDPYIKLGRLAVLPEFRKLGLGKLLVDTCLSWASHHAHEILPPRSAASREQAKVDGLENAYQDKWSGLIMVHAQKEVEKLWTSYGFKKDEKLGEWEEEGIKHVGMWRRIKLKE